MNCPKDIIVDFGASFFFSKPLGDPLRTTMFYRKLELFFRGKPPYESDNWSLACVIFEMRVGRSLLDKWFVDEDEQLISQIIRFFSPRPDSWQTLRQKEDFSMPQPAENEQHFLLGQAVKEIGENDEEEPEYSDTDWYEASIDEEEDVLKEGRDREREVKDRAKGSRNAGNVANYRTALCSEDEW